MKITVREHGQKYKVFFDTGIKWIDISGITFEADDKEGYADVYINVPSQDNKPGVYSLIATRDKNGDSEALNSRIHGNIKFELND